MMIFDCAKAALEKNAENIRILDLRHISSFADHFVICSARSNRQVQAICDNIEKTAKEQKIRPLSMDGYSEGRWVVVDIGDVVVHVFLDELRDYYDLETLWSDAKRVPIPAELLGPGASRLA